MRSLTEDSASKLQKILSKRIGKELSDLELEQAYDALMDFAEALIGLNEGQESGPYNSKVCASRRFRPIALEQNILYIMYNVNGGLRVEKRITDY